VTLAQTLVTCAIEKGVTITTAESCTGGMVSAAITDIAGSSAMFERGFVTYSNGAKRDTLSVNRATLDAHGAVSEQVAREMALGAAQNAKADIAVSITGIAGPGGSDYKPEGRVCFGIAVRGDVTTQTVEFGALGRAQVRARSMDTALTLLQDAVDSL